MNIFQKFCFMFLFIHSSYWGWCQNKHWYFEWINVDEIQKEQFLALLEKSVETNCVEILTEVHKTFKTTSQPKIYFDPGLLTYQSNLKTSLRKYLKPEPVEITRLRNGISSAITTGLPNPSDLFNIITEVTHSNRISWRYSETYSMYLCYSVHNSQPYVGEIPDDVKKYWKNFLTQIPDKSKMGKSFLELFLSFSNSAGADSPRIALQNTLFETSVKEGLKIPPTVQEPNLRHCIEYSFPFCHLEIDSLGRLIVTDNRTIQANP